MFHSELSTPRRLARATRWGPSCDVSDVVLTADHLHNYNPQKLIIYCLVY